MGRRLKYSPRASSAPQSFRPILGAGATACSPGPLVTDLPVLTPKSIVLTYALPSMQTCFRSSELELRGPRNDLSCSPCKASSGGFG
eukprot:4204902-Alexandrium_andersonii.AAC.1